MVYCNGKYQDIKRAPSSLVALILAKKNQTTSVCKPAHKVAQTSLVCIYGGACFPCWQAIVSTQSFAEPTTWLSFGQIAIPLRQLNHCRKVSSTKSNGHIQRKKACFFYHTHRLSLRTYMHLDALGAFIIGIHNLEHSCFSHVPLHTIVHLDDLFQYAILPHTHQTYQLF